LTPISGYNPPMALKIETFSNAKGGDSFFKAIGHPNAQTAIRALLRRLTAARPIAIYDPHGTASAFAEIHPLDASGIAGVFVQSVSEIGTSILGHRAQPITDLADNDVGALFVPVFDAERIVAQMRHLVPAGAVILTLDDTRLSETFLTNKRRYLDPLNFATNFAFFRDGSGVHTRVVTANYWAGYGAKEVALWMCLFDESGAVVAEWRETLGAGTTGVVVDSREVRRRFRLGDFVGQLFIHAIGAAGHDVVKYALDVFGERAQELTCTHDANAWPADFYAGLPAPAADEKVVLWVQNSHPRPIPAKTVGLNLMGEDEVALLDRDIPAFGTYALDIAQLLPQARWPAQIEIRAGRHFVRPRYEIVTGSGHRRLAHPNVERIDLKPDPHLPELANLIGKGFLLPAPVLPHDQFRSIVLPTPMATTQSELPVALKLYDATGKEAATHYLGRLPRNHRIAVDVDALLNGSAGEALPSGYGHMELLYDFRDGGAGDGWLHALFRYEDRGSGHAAETSFGAHVFNTVLTYKNEPQSYTGTPPGLSTRLFLRLGSDSFDTLCHLIYPASTPWHETSDTTLTLHHRAGGEIAKVTLRISCSGSVLWHASTMFGRDALARAGDGGFVIIRDTTCRLFGYHGLLAGKDAFSLDHMFGF
jgi:hypothetical protein